MNQYILDTHPLYWYFTDSNRLGQHAASIFRSADQGRATLVIPVITLVELTSIYEKLQPRRQFKSDLEFLKDANQFRIASLEADDLLFMPSRDLIPELHDRLIVALALKLRLPCITQDARIVQSKLIDTLW